MLNVLFLILKIIGITLLIVIGILLCLLLIVLFVPLRYKVYAQKDSDENSSIEARVSASFLLHLLNVHFDYPSDDPLSIRIAFIRLNRKNKPNKDVNKEKSKEIITESLAEDTIEETIEDRTSAKEIKNDESFFKDATKDKRDKKKRNKEKKIKPDTDNSEGGFFEKVKSNISSLIGKAKNIKKDIDYYKRIIESDTFKRAFNLVKNKLFKIIKMVFPRKLKGSIQYGSYEKPDSVGEFFGIYSVFYPLIHDKILFVPYFEKDVFAFDVTARGYLQLYKFVIIAVTIYFNKDIKRLIKLFKKERINGRK